MKGLDSENSTFILIPESNKIDAIYSILYSMNYNLIELTHINNDNKRSAIMAYGVLDNNTLRENILFILNEFNIDFTYIKYKDDNIIRKIYNNGSEKLVKLESNIINYDNYFIYEHNIFTFIEICRYFKPTSMNDFKKGMIVEYLIDNVWKEKVVENPISEYNDMYKLLIKYNKLRIPQY